MKEMDSRTNEEYGLTGQGVDSKLVFRNSTPKFTNPEKDLKALLMEEGNDEPINPEELGINPGESQAEREGRRALLASIVEQRGDKPLSEEEMERLDQILSPTPRIEEAPENPPQASSEGGQGGGNPPPPTAEGGMEFDEENDREERYLNLVGQLRNNPHRFNILLQGIKLIAPQDLRKMFITGAKAHISFIVSALGEDLIDHEKYEKQFLKAFQADNQDLKVLLRNTIHEIREELINDAREREKPTIVREVVEGPDGQIAETADNPQRQARERRERELQESEAREARSREEVIKNLDNSSEGENRYQIKDTGMKWIESLLPDILGTDAKKIDLAMNEFQAFGDTRIGMIYEKNMIQHKHREWENILRTQNPLELIGKINAFLIEADKQHQKNIIEGKEVVAQEPESIQDLARHIIRKQDSTLYGRHGKYPLLETVIDEETHQERDVFNPHNFMIWIRDRASKLHADNANTEISFLGSVGVETYIRTVSIYQMTQNRAQYFKDEITGEVFDDLAEQALNEAWGFGVTRNMDLNYQKVMNSDTDLPKAIVGLYAGNDLTRSTLLKMFSQMPDNFGEEVIDKNGEKMKGIKESKLGNAFMLAEDIYYNLPDVEELKYVAGENSPMFSEEWFRTALMMQQGKLDWEDPDSTQFYDADSKTFYWKDAKTGEKRDVFKDGKIDEFAYYNFINYFLDATPDDTKVAFVRELVRFTAAEEYGIKNGLLGEKEREEKRAEYDRLPSRVDIEDFKLKDTFTKEKLRAQILGERRTDRINLEWAETNSFVTIRPLLIAAKNDTGRRGYDAETKLSVLNYLLRQSGDTTAGPIGNPEALGIFRNLSVDALAGLKTESGLSPEDIYRFIRDMERGGVQWVNKTQKDGTTKRVLTDIRHGALTKDEIASATRVEGKELINLKNEWLEKLKFPQKAMTDYASNQVNRAYEIFHSMSGGEQLNLGKIVSYDPWKGIVYDYAAFEDLVKDKFIKPMRYAFASNSALNYGSMVRVFVRLDKDTKQPIFEDRLLVDHMFGHDVTDEIWKDTSEGKILAKRVNSKGELEERALTYEEYVNSSEGRTRLVKNAARARFAAELRSHRKYGLAGERWNAEMVDVMLKAFLTLKEYEEDPETGDIRESGKSFFTKDDIAWIRKHSGTERYKLAAETYGFAAGEGLFKSLGAFKLLFSGIVDLD